ncbi:GNAT family N-acetyltransferase [Nocardia goodfellowii]|uniref:GNAT superfamily N-acetyltransferase n=1 Tax=Nocardia goodfellowii TaxID=882446 RepID=A0ABS4QN41_9NOCA|nr:GNAT family N-acetyltransferase [Nocardia goodfellowii]MBP2193127.1 GNAT superfamily N-acetyltransferase [Nocardia goodfellowii]
MSFTIEPLGPDDLPACVAVFADAFVDDPVYSFIWPDEQMRRAKLPQLFTLRLPLAQQAWMARDEDGEPAAVAVWDTSEPSKAEWAQARSMPEVRSFFGSRLHAVDAVVSAIDDSRPTTPHWYLDDFATAVKHRGGGAGLALIADRLEYCDRHNIDIYGVCTSESTLAFYEKSGAVLTGEIRIPDGPRLWGMLRTAR